MAMLAKLAIRQMVIFRGKAEEISWNNQETNIEIGNRKKNISWNSSCQGHPWDMHITSIDKTMLIGLALIFRLKYLYDSYKPNITKYTFKKISSIKISIDFVPTDFWISPLSDISPSLIFISRNFVSFFIQNFADLKISSNTNFRRFVKFTK